MNEIKIVFIGLILIIAVTFLISFVTSIGPSFQVTDIVVELTPSGYILKWSPATSYPDKVNRYQIDYILTVRGRNAPRIKQVTTENSIPIIWRGKILQPENQPSDIRGIIVTRSRNNFNSDPRYFDLPFYK